MKVGAGWGQTRSYQPQRPYLEEKKERKKKDWKWSSMVEYLPRVCKALGLDPKQIRCALGLA